MEKYFIRLKDVPSYGLNLEIADQEIWTSSIEEYGLPYRIIEEFSSKIKILVDNDICIIKGYIKGALSIPCDRCAEDATIEIYEEFKTIEEPQKKDVLDVSFIVEKDGEIYLDLRGILWERLMLNVPVKILCLEDCKGLCAHCGTNLNMDSCNCKNQMLDPRLQILRKIKIS